MTNIKAEIDETEQKKINRTKNWFFAKINTTDKLLAGLMRKRERRAKLAVSRM